MSAMACSGVATLLSMLGPLLFQSKTLDDAFLDCVLLARPAGVILGVEITSDLVVLFHRLHEVRIVERFTECIVQRLPDFRLQAFGPADAVRRARVHIVTLFFCGRNLRPALDAIGAE